MYVVVLDDSCAAGKILVSSFDSAVGSESDAARRFTDSSLADADAH